MILSVILLVAGLALLVISADVLVDASAKLARALGVPAAVVGLTIVAFGTSAPEMASGVAFALADRGEVVVGAVLGSNIANIALILGVTALVSPVPCRRSFTVVEVPLMIVLSVLALGLMVDGQVSTLESAGLMALAFAYVARPPSDREELEREFADEQSEPEDRRVGFRLVLIVAGIIGLTVGAQLLISGAEDLARTLGVPEYIIGLSLVALGTSLPELVTGIRAAMKDHADIAIGNVIGSNVFNLLAVVGLSGFFGDIRVPPSVLGRDAPIVLVLSLVCLPVMVTGRRITRFEGLLLSGAYASYIVLLYLTRGS